MRSILLPVSRVLSEQEGPQMKVKISASVRWLISFCILASPLALMALQPVPASADGGPWVSSSMWSSLTEGQQVAVITADGLDSAKIDLFVSILDQTGESHEINFFLPLGTRASDFYVVEQNVNDFSDKNTTALDSLLKSSANERHTALTSLFAGNVLAGGYILAPFWAPVLLSSCGGVEPLATYHTSSSDVSIFDVSADTDINELSAAAGLPDGVRNTLAQLRGQQIAVVKLRTQAQSSAGSSSSYYGQNSEPGLHLSWTAGLVDAGGIKSFTYSLGTGGAWSKPIEMTRVYIFAPPGMDFSIEYPKLGSDQTGYTGLFGHPRIVDYYKVPAYAVDEARGDFGKLWRITYTQSNPTEDINISFTPQSGWSKFQSGLAENIGWLSFIFALVAGPLMWMLAWIFVMPRLARRGDKPEALRWYNGLIYSGVNTVMLVIPGTILLLMLTLGLVIPSLAAVFILFGGMAILIFWLAHAGRIGISRKRALGAFVLTGLVSSAAYLGLAMGFAWMSGII